MISLQKLSTLGIKPDRETPKNSRSYLDTGKLCNYNCEFCYYKDQLTERDSFEKIKQRIDHIFDYGNRQIDMAGGESSVEPNWFKILEYCTTKGFTHISTLSNGSKFANLEFLQKSKDYGLKEILFSLHGYNEENHDEIVGVKGAFKKILQAIENAHNLGIIVRVNCTVYDMNYSHLHDLYPELIKKVKPLEVNYIAVKYDSDNKEFRRVSYKEITDQIKKSIDNIKDHVKFINVRFVPFCFLEGYEQYACNHYQHIYDLYDWNRATYNQVYDTSKTYTPEEKLRQDMDICAWFRIEGFHKEDTCKECKYFYICDGIDKKLKGEELIHIEGKKIHEINHFRKDFYADVYSDFDA